MENPKSTSGLKAVIVVLVLLLAASLAYIFKMTSDVSTIETELTTAKTEKNNVLDSLAVLKSTYDIAIEEKTALSDDLIAEREKVIHLIADLEKSKGDAASMEKYRDQYMKLQSNMKKLIAENRALKRANNKLTVERDSTIVVLGEQRKAADTLTSRNVTLVKTVEKASKLVVINLSTQAIKQKSSGKQIETERASRTDKLKVCFTIVENAVAKSGEKTYYIQIIDSKNNVLGDKRTENFNGDLLTYSFLTTVAYDNKSLDVCEFLENQENNDFEKGTYFVNVFDRGELVSKTSFKLK
jgi:Holliday junction resolvase